MKKLQSIMNKYCSVIAIVIAIFIWGIITYFDLVPRFMLPSPLDVMKAFLEDFSLIFKHLCVTMIEAIVGLLISIILSFILAIFMDRYKIVDKTLYPLIVLSQTFPTIAIAPIIVLWFGFGMMPKILLIVSTCFFPMTVSILTGFKNVNIDMIRLMETMNSTYIKTLLLVKIPLCMKSFFAGLKISATYSIVGAVVAEWIGGENGIGVYMTRVKKAYAFDKMFASIIIISICSILLVQVVKIIERKVIYWEDDE